MITSTQAIVRIGHQRSDFAAHLKRLALIFDRILFVLPEHWTVKDEVIADPARTERLPNGQIRLKGGIDPFRDTLPRVKIPIGQLGSDLDHVLEVLVGHGIAEECDPTRLAFQTDLDAYEKVRQDLGWSEATDERFLELSKTSSISIPFRLESLTVGSASGSTRVLHIAYPPLAVIDSSDLTATLFAAQRTGSSPVFTSATHRAELAYRYEQYQKGLLVLCNELGDLIPDGLFESKFGSVSFHLANALVDSQSIERLQIEDIVELRSSLEEARRRFVSEYLVEATSLVENNPWDDRLRDELKNFVEGPLASELLRYNEESRSRSESLVRKIGGHLTIDLPRSLLTAAVAGHAGVSANVLPGVSPWQLAVVAAIGVMYKEATDIGNDVIEKIYQDRTARRSSIAYVAEIARSASRT